MLLLARVRKLSEQSNTIIEGDYINIYIFSDCYTLLLGQLF